MNRFLTVLLFLFGLLSPVLAQMTQTTRQIQVVPTENRYALLIGVSEYPRTKLKTLPGAVKDMTDLADALEKYAGFPRENITVMTDADDTPEELLPKKANILQKVKEICGKLQKGDMLIVAFSGHGVTIKFNENSECPSLCVGDTDLLKLETLIRRSWLFEQVNECAAGRKLIFFDACRSMNTPEEIYEYASRGDADNVEIKAMESPAETWKYQYVLYSSCASGQISVDIGSNGLFTSYLLEGLRTGRAAMQNGDLTAFSWFEYAAQKTEEASKPILKAHPEWNVEQTQQNPCIECRGEMARFVIAKMDPAGINVAIPQNVEEVEVQQYQVGGLKIELTPMEQSAPGTAIQAGKIQLPPVPERILELTGILRGIDDALARMKAGTHEALKEANLVKAAAQKQYIDLKSRRDEEWKDLPTDVQTSLETRIRESPTAKPTTLATLRPKDVSFSQFIKLVLWGQKTEQAHLELKRVEKEVADAIDTEISRIEQAKTTQTAELEKETENFRRTVVQFLLTKSPGWDSRDDGAELDYMFLSETIPSLLKYPFGWEEEALFALAEEIWANNRPYVVEQKEKQRKAEEEKRRQEEAEKRRIAEQRRLEEINRKAGTRKVFTVDGIEYAFRWCPPGEFTMGSPEDEPGRPSSKPGSYDDETQHKVKLTRGFWLMETEVTQAMWESVMGSNPSEFKGTSNPVEQVSWNDCQEFCKRLSQKLGQQVQLPTEAQWEYACRAGTTGAYAGNLDELGWYDDNSGSETHGVGLKKPNAWGLYDMHGNVYEWCLDRYGEKYYAESPTSDPTGPTSGSNRVFRGGSWFNVAGLCRSADRYGGDPVHRSNNLGLRVLVVSVQ